MTPPPRRRRRTVTVQPFPADDPLSYRELTPLMRTQRALLAVLADTGAVVVFPEHLAPGPVSMEVAAGWRLRVEHRNVPNSPGDVEYRAQWVDLPEFSVPAPGTRAPAPGLEP